MVGPFLFVIISVVLLVLTAVLYFGGETLASVKNVPLGATVPYKEGLEPWERLDFLQTLWWTVLYRLATRAGAVLVLGMFCALEGWLTWLTVFWLSTPWQIAYVALACFGLMLLTLETKYNLPAVKVALVFVLLSLVWAFLHFSGQTHVTIPSIHIPRIDFRIP
jgi:hypothetical protein